MEQLEPWYVTGLCDGNASFTFSRQGGSLAALYFALKMSALERPLLERVRAHFGGGGSIYDARPRSVYYRVTHLDELIAVVEHFDAYPLRGRRRESYDVWRELYQIRMSFRRAPLSPSAKDRFEGQLVRLSSLCIRKGRESPVRG